MQAPQDDRSVEQRNKERLSAKPPTLSPSSSRLS